MKIGIYDPYLDDLGGGEKYMMTIAECLAARHEVDVFWDNTRDFEAVKNRFSLNLDKVHVVANIFSPKVGSRQRFFATNNYDVLIVLSDGSIPLVLSKNLFVHLQQPMERMETRSLKGKFKLSRITAIFYNSQFTQSYNEKYIGGTNNLVIYPPVHVLSKNIAKQNSILHVGRFRVKEIHGIDDYKKQHVMIDAFKKMVDKKLVSQWKFVIAASVHEKDMDLFSKMQETAKHYPIEFLVNKTNDELWDAYNKAKIYWHASGYGENLEKHPEYAEHFGISTVEAMGAGVVPVVINAGGQREIVNDGKDGFLWNTLDDLEERTRQLMTNNALLDKMSEAAKQRANDFSKERFCEEIMRLVRG